MKPIPTFIASFGATALLVALGYGLADCPETNSAKKIANLIFMLPVFICPVQAITAILLPRFSTGRLFYCIAALLVGLLFLNFYCVANFGEGLGELIAGGYFAERPVDACLDIRGPALLLLILVPVALIVKLILLMSAR